MVKPTRKSEAIRGPFEGINEVDETEEDDEIKTESDESPSMKERRPASPASSTEMLDSSKDHTEGYQASGSLDSAQFVLVANSEFETSN